MTVKQILDQKGRKVVTVDPSMGTEEAVRFLSDNKIGAVVVTGAGGKIAGHSFRA
jgi:CBS domain-containing protein